MPVCKRCTTHFPNRIKINGEPKNLKSRKYCLDCSPFNSHNTGKLTTTSWLPDRSKTLVCERCNRTYVYMRLNRNGCTSKFCNACVLNVRRVARKARAITYKGGRCQDCGYDRCPEALEFHHLDRSEKDGNISQMGWKSWAAVITELDKCVLLCANCHRETHAKMSASARLVSSVA